MRSIDYENEKKHDHKPTAQKKSNKIEIEERKVSKQNSKNAHSKQQSSSTSSLGIEDHEDMDPEDFI